MPEANKITKEDPKVELDTSGPEVDVTLPDQGTRNSKRSRKRRNSKRNKEGTKR